MAGSGSEASSTGRTIGLMAATSIVIASMVGTGVFTSLGFQLPGTPASVPVLLLWVVGGILALCGTLCYGELGSAMPRSGGEYHYLTTLYHPSVGFLSGFVSSTVGFSAPMALAAMAFGKYACGIWPALPPNVLATLLILVVTGVHLLEVRVGGGFQSVTTVVNVGLILFFIAAGLTVIASPMHVALMPVAADWKMTFSSAFAVSLVYVSYAYSGWNGSIYLASEVRNPSVQVPRSVFLGTVIVMVLYVLLNFLFLRSTPIADLSGKLEVGLISAINVFGPVGGKIMGAFISLILVATVSAMVMAGPRVLKTIGQDYPRLAIFAKENRRGVPWIAILTQSAIALVLIWSSTFEKVLTYTGFVLALFTTVTVAGLFRLRSRKPAGSYPYRTWGYPVTPVLFLALNLWMIVFLLKGRPVESLAGLATLALGLIVYFAVKRKGEV